LDIKDLAKEHVQEWINENLDPAERLRIIPSILGDDLQTHILFTNEVEREASENCIHFLKCDVRRGGCCSIRGNKKIKHKFCHDACPDRTYRSRGLGDTVKKIIKKITLGKLTPKSKGCGCNKRRKKLNDLISYN
tara:strand:+ start:3693 stop:4097 length:405 start_codon:yes stop_codon:yes gene_type:complete